MVDDLEAVAAVGADGNFGGGIGASPHPRGGDGSTLGGIGGTRRGDYRAAHRGGVSFGEVTAGVTAATGRGTGGQQRRYG